MTATAVLTRPATTRARSGDRSQRAATAVAFPSTWGPWRAPAPRPQLHVVPARTHARRRRRTIVGAWAVVLTLLTVVGFHALLAQSQIALARLEERTAAAERRYENARWKYAQAASPAQITARARELGMLSPGGPPTPVLIAGEVPEAPDAPTTTLNGWTDVKPTLGANG
ncbi:MAG: hypothetical protein WD598_07450 [Acidimicrobiia bacterium]